VTARRHRHYRRALDLIATVDPLWLSSDGRARLEDRAEEMLLTTTEEGPSVTRLRSETAGDVRAMVAAGLLPPGVAEELTGLLLAAGPSAPGSADARSTGARRAA
jgi:hypothetical protein